MKKNTIIFTLVLVVLIGAGYYIQHTFFSNQSATGTTVATEDEQGTINQRRNFFASSTQEERELDALDIPEEIAAQQAGETDNALVEVIGTSVNNLPIQAYHFGTGANEVVLVGGIHGGYEWNTPLLIYQVIDYYTEQPDAIPSGVRLTVIPTLNPDGLYTATGKVGRFVPQDVSQNQEVVVSSRFNAHNVDINRNFDCDWQAEGVWQQRTVSGGTGPFSEPESVALRNYVKTHTPAAVIAYFSSAGGVYASACHNGILADTQNLTNRYAEASGYDAYEKFDFYKVTGDVTNWLAKENIPAISVLLSDHTNTEYAKNISGIAAVLSQYAQQ